MFQRDVTSQERRTFRMTLSDDYGLSYHMGAERISDYVHKLNLFHSRAKLHHKILHTVASEDYLSRCRYSILSDLQTTMSHIFYA